MIGQAKDHINPFTVKSGLLVGGNYLNIALQTKVRSHFNTMFTRYGGKDSGNNFCKLLINELYLHTIL